MRKLCLTLMAAAAVLATGALTANATTFGAAGGLRSAIEDPTIVDQVRWSCTHFWYGRYHRQPQCVWLGGHRYGHFHGHRYDRFYGHSPRHFNSYGYGYRRHFW